jgi:hypothetical protein
MLLSSCTIWVFKVLCNIWGGRNRICVVLTNFDNGTVSSVGYEKVANPSVSGINTSATVSNTAVATELHKPDVNLTTSVSLHWLPITALWKLWCTNRNQWCCLKFEVAGGGSLGEIKVANTKINEWEELTLTSTDKLVSRVNGYSKIRIF